jgi:extradiol dioxygenase
MGISKLGYVGLDVSDIAAWQDMLKGTFGVDAPLAGEGDDAVALAEIDVFKYRLALYPADANAPRHIGWLVDSTPELDRLTDRLETAGFQVNEATSAETDLRGAVTLRWFTDPVGYRVELAVGEAKARADVPRPADASPGVIGMGHLVLASPQLEELRHLYETVLEFKLTDYRAPNVFFFRCNRTHHSIALAQADTTMIHHLELEHADLDGVGRAHDRAVENGVPVSISLGRHMNDRAISFYVKNPSGFHLEIGCGGIEIPDGWVPHDFGTSDVWGHHHAAHNPFAQS